MQHVQPMNLIENQYTQKTIMIITLGNEWNMKFESQSVLRLLKET